VDPEAARLDGSPLFTLIHPEDRDGVVVALEASARQLSNFAQEWRVRYPDGTEGWHGGNAVPHRERDGAILWHGFITDITERKRAEAHLQVFERKLQQTQKLESLGLLAGGIAHDFNNLLTGILGNASLVALALEPASPAEEFVDPIKQGCQRAAELCKQLLAYSGKGRFEVRKIGLHALIEDTTQLLRHSISKQCELHFDLAAEIPPIEGDATQLRQVIMNLVINASEAIGDKAGVIRLSTSVVRLVPGGSSDPELGANVAPGTYVCLEVGDNGCGMSPETQAKIFDPFFTTKFTGRGLGLAAVHGIVRGHRGVLKVYSEAGHGTTFKLLFPSAEGIADPLNRPAVNARSWRGAGCILLADDEQAVRQATAAMLRGLGFSVVPATDGQEAVGLFRADPAKFSAVLLDLTMPHLDGKQAFLEMHRVRPDVRVILMSGFNEEEVVSEFAGKRLAGFLQKPFEVDSLGTILQRALAATAATSR
jgi:signal transduction histidine kinase/CheY-like chemotaxis protein